MRFANRSIALSLGAALLVFALTGCAVRSTPIPKAYEMLGYSTPIEIEAAYVHQQGLPRQAA